MTPVNKNPTSRARQGVSLALGLLGLALVCGATSAQAGVVVRAPFTHVGVDHDRGVHVAAPFTRVNVGHERAYREPDRRDVRRHLDYGRDWRHGRRDAWHRDRRAEYRGYRSGYGYGYGGRSRYERPDRDRGWFGHW